MTTSSFTPIYDDDLANYDMKNNPMLYDFLKLAPRGIAWDQGGRHLSHMFRSAGFACELPDRRGFAVLDIGENQKGQAYFIDREGNVFDKVDIAPGFAITKADFLDVFDNEGSEEINFIFRYEDNSWYNYCAFVDRYTLKTIRISQTK
ncbi:MAG: hypothetical protein FWD68_10990 [Alphaproteobacteria bacterium]|nr:hypothetical protein [Alphaproteobacteria bacterium]